MKRIILAALVLASLAGFANAQTYDTVIMNGRVMDPETNFDGIANVAISGGWIVKITEDEIKGRETIDATGHVVTAGFIDTHTHSGDKFTIKMSMMDGVTSGMDTEFGAMNIASWYERENGKWPMNYGQCVSHEFARMIVMDKLKITEPVDAQNAFALRAKSTEDDDVADWSVTRSTLDQMNAISAILDKGLQEGALCVGSTVGYASKGITTYEMYQAQKTAARYGRPIGVHSRFHTSSATPTEAALGFDEVFTNAFLLDAPLIYSHNNDYGWWEIEEKLQAARAKGLNMWSEYYPYTAGSTSIGSDQIKPEALAVLGLKTDDVMYDPTSNKYLTEEEYKKIVAEDSGRAVIVFNPARKEWLPQWLRVRHMTVGSDSMWQEKGLGYDDDPAKFAGHPRTSGAHSSVLKLAREQKVPLMHTLSQLSYWSAYHLGKMGLKFMDVRGRMQVGMVADIVIFDPDKVAPGSDYSAGTQGLPPVSLPHVMVSGIFVKHDNKATGKLPGQAIRFEPESEPRFETIDTRIWKQTYTLQDGALD